MRVVEIMKELEKKFILDIVYWEAGSSNTSVAFFFRWGSSNMGRSSNMRGSLNMIMALKQGFLQ